jgi:bacillithiol biosynthesis cysteine-adding enzyme BshC
MFSSRRIDPELTGSYHRLTLDYIGNKPELRAYYQYAPDLEGFRTFLKGDPYSKLNRKELAEIIRSQSATVENTTEKSVSNIQLIEKPNSFVVVTGHQLCLMTGPLYFVYKLLSAVALSHRLTREFPGYHFVPVYWMASEDHDFEEINHFSSEGKSITWQSSQTGAAGDLSTDELGALLPGLKELFGSGSGSEELLSLFEGAYLKHPNLSSATRWLVNELFGDYGIVTVDGNEKTWKGNAQDIFSCDLFDSVPYKAVNESIAGLEVLGYKSQVNPRESNCFYLDKRVRSRIVISGNSFEVADTSIRFSRAEMEDLLKNNPEKISPNVVLRPVYQQRILPCIAYVGGPAEIAYWLEYKKMFDELGATYPILVPRASFTVIDSGIASRISAAGLMPDEIFLPASELEKKVISAEKEYPAFDREVETLKGIYEGLKAKTEQVDKTLGASVLAELQKSLNGLQNIEGKITRALKKKLEVRISRIHVIKEKLFPQGSLQERKENFATFYLRFGRKFFDEIVENADPLIQGHCIMLEE